MAVITIRISDEIKEELNKIAEKQDRNMSWVARKAIEDYLFEFKKQEENNK